MTREQATTMTLRVFKKPKQRKQSRRKKVNRGDGVQDEDRDVANQNATTSKATLFAATQL